MRFVNHILPFLDALKLGIQQSQLDAFEALGGNLLDDPLYSSVSKILEPSEIATKHFLDSIAPVALNIPCWKSSGTILDIGTGAGFPALPLAILFPMRRIVAVDSKGKAIDFVSRMIEKAGLGNVEPLLARAEELGRMKKFREKCDLVVCRAVSSLRVLLELCLPLVKIGGVALFYKGPDIEAELSESCKAFQILGIKREEQKVFSLKQPELPFNRSYLIIEKRRSVPETYPRRNGVPASNPI